MEYTKKILERASIKGVADYLLFGIGPDPDGRSYEKRLEDAQQKFDTEVMELNRVAGGRILDLANEMTCRVAMVYAELGMQASLLFVKDMFTHMDVHTDEPISVERGVSDFLLGQVQAAIRQTEKPGEENRERAVSLLKRAIAIAETMLEESV